MGLLRTDPQILEYFRSHKESVMFALLELDGEHRMNMLGIMRFHYCSQSAAYDWRTAIEKLILDGPEHPRDNEALLAVNRMYNRMAR